MWAHLQVILLLIFAASQCAHSELYHIHEQELSRAHTPRACTVIMAIYI